MDLLTAVLQTILQQEPFCGERLIMRVQQKPLKSDVMVWDDIALDRKAKFELDPKLRQLAKVESCP
jgi:hypothetical protein